MKNTSHKNTVWTIKYDISKIEPLINSAEIREYWSIESKLGLGFKAGKEILNNINKYCN